VRRTPTELPQTVEHVLRDCPFLSLYLGLSPTPTPNYSQLLARSLARTHTHTHTLAHTLGLSPTHTLPLPPPCSLPPPSSCPLVPAVALSVSRRHAAAFCTHRPAPPLSVPAPAPCPLPPQSRALCAHRCAALRSDPHGLCPTACASPLQYIMFQTVKLDHTMFRSSRHVGIAPQQDAEAARSLCSSLYQDQKSWAKLSSSVRSYRRQYRRTAK